VSQINFSHQSSKVSFWSPETNQKLKNMFSSVIEGVEHESVVRFEISGRAQKFFEKTAKLFKNK
jgi:hypothetical protein